MKRFAVVACAALAGCSTSTLPPPMNVRTTTVTAEVARCQLLGSVRGDHNLYGGHMPIAQQAAESALLNSAAKLGGNTVLLEKSNAGYFGVNLAGKAYRC